MHGRLINTGEAASSHGQVMCWRRRLPNYVLYMRRTEIQNTDGTRGYTEMVRFIASYDQP